MGLLFELFFVLIERKNRRRNFILFERREIKERTYFLERNIIYFIEKKKNEKSYFIEKRIRLILLKKMKVGFLEMKK